MVPPPPPLTLLHLLADGEWVLPLILPPPPYRRSPPPPPPTRHPPLDRYIAGNGIANCTETSDGAGASFQPGKGDSCVRLDTPNPVTLYCQTYAKEYEAARTHATCTPCNADTDCPGDRACWAAANCTSKLKCGNTTDAACAPNKTAVWIDCAAEHAQCSFSGKKRVRYGAAGKYVSQMHTDGVKCSNDVFGDPNAMTLKRCAYQSFTANSTAPANLTCSSYNTGWQDTYNLGCKDYVTNNRCLDTKFDITSGGSAVGTRMPPAVAGGAQGNCKTCCLLASGSGVATNPIPVVTPDIPTNSTAGKENLGRIKELEKALGDVGKTNANALLDVVDAMTNEMEQTSFNASTETAQALRKKMVDGVGRAAKILFGGHGASSSGSTSATNSSVGNGTSSRAAAPVFIPILNDSEKTKWRMGVWEVVSSLGALTERVDQLDDATIEQTLGLSATLAFNSKVARGVYGYVRVVVQMTSV